MPVHPDQVRQNTLARANLSRKAEVYLGITLSQPFIKSLTQTPPDDTGFANFITHKREELNEIMRQHADVSGPKAHAAARDVIQNLVKDTQARSVYLHSLDKIDPKSPKVFTALKQLDERVQLHLKKVLREQNR